MWLVIIKRLGERDNLWKLHMHHARWSAHHHPVICSTHPWKLLLLIGEICSYCIFLWIQKHAPLSWMGWEGRGIEFHGKSSEWMNQSTVVILRSNGSKRRLRKFATFWLIGSYKFCFFCFLVVFEGSFGKMVWIFSPCEEWFMSL